METHAIWETSIGNRKTYTMRLPDRSGRDNRGGIRMVDDFSQRFSGFRPVTKMLRVANFSFSDTFFRIAARSGALVYDVKVDAAHQHLILLLRQRVSHFE